jgi:16S rRNA (uracil1498-N3)-methyltransferase
MSDRFFVEEPISGAAAKLVGQEAQHLLKVLRAKIGDEITVFDGSGDEFTARVSSHSRSEVELEILERRPINRELNFHLTMGVALPKGDRQRWLVEKLTELGVTELVPLRTVRGVAQPVDQALVRLRRFVVEASKQCGRNRLMAIGEPQSCVDFTAAIPTGSIRLIAHPSPVAKPIQRIGEAREVAVAIGPEGGFTDEEVSNAIAQGWQSIQLGTRILRVETAAVTVAAMLSNPLV